jgi:hypothetical protein
MRRLLVLFFPFAGILSFSGHPHSDFIDPTGTYLLKGDVKGNKVVSHSAEMRARLLDGEKVALCFYMNSGYPSYTYGAFVDTFAYDNNCIRYSPKNDSACMLIVSFRLLDAEMVGVYSDPHASCGFGQGALEPAILKKVSSEKPLIQDLSKHRGGGALQGAETSRG